MISSATNQRTQRTQKTLLHEAIQKIENKVSAPPRYIIKTDVTKENIVEDLQQTIKILEDIKKNSKSLAECSVSSNKSNVNYVDGEVSDEEVSDKTDIFELCWDCIDIINYFNLDPDDSLESILNPLHYLQKELNSSENYANTSSDILTNNTQEDAVVSQSSQGLQHKLNSLENDANTSSNINYISNNGETPLISAVRKGDETCINTLLDDHVDIHATSEEGYTALHIASMKGYDTVVEKLIKLGADVNVKVKDNKGITALMLATKSGKEQCIDILLNNHAEINATSISGHTALHIALWKGYHSIVEKLTKAGIDVNIRARNGMTVLMYAAKQASKNSTHDDNPIHIKVVELLLQYTENTEKVLVDLKEQKEFEAIKLIEALLSNKRSGK